MKKIIEKGKHTGYNIGEDIYIHRHIHYPEDWMLTVRPLKIFGEQLCNLSCTEEEIARYVVLKLTKIKNSVEQLLAITYPHT